MYYKCKNVTKYNIFLCISRRPLDACENLMRVKIIIMIEQIELTGIWYNFTTQICRLEPDVQKFSSMNISTLTSLITSTDRGVIKEGQKTSKQPLRKRKSLPYFFSYPCWMTE